MVFDPEHFWKVTKRRRGEPTLSANAMLEGAFEYFEWITNHPLREEIHHYDKTEARFVKDYTTKMRAFTLAGLATFLGVTERALHLARDERDAGGERTERARVYEYIYQIIYTQKFEGAAAGLLNANIIIRDLGLAEKQELSGPGGGPIHQSYGPDELADELERRGLPRDMIDGILGGTLPPGDDGNHVLPEEPEE